MNWRCALVLCGLAAVALAQDASPAATARTGLEGAAAKDPKTLASALARRGGDWFDVVLSVIGDPMPPLDPTKAVVAGLPEPEKKGIGPILDAMAAAPAPARIAFAAAAGNLTVAVRGFADTHADPKNATEAAAAAENRAKEANHEWTTARAAIAKAIGGFDAGIADQEPALLAAEKKLAELGDRFDAAIAAAFHAKAFADAGDLDKAEAARNRAQAGLKELGALDKGGAAIKGMLARIDLALAGPLMDDGRDDAALEACTRARAIYKSADPARDLEASSIEAMILNDRGNFAGAVEATKAHVPKLRTIKDRPTLVRFSTAVATAMRCSGKAAAALDFLRNAVARANELGATPVDHARLRSAMALVYLATQQNEPAVAALEVVAKLAENPEVKEPDLLPIAKAALLNRAILLQTQNRGEAEVNKALERAKAMVLGGPTLERIAMGGPALAFGEIFVAQNKPKEALRWVKEAAAVAEDLGVRLEDVRVPSTLVASTSGEALHVRLAAAFGGYESGPDWSGFEPVFMVTERRLLEVLAKGAPDEPAPADMQERLRESDRLVLKLRRAATGARAPVPEEEARRIVAFRRVMMDEAQSRAPTFALRRFPRAGSIKRARENYCGPDGVVFGASVTPQGAYAFAFSRDRFCFSAIDVSTRINDAVANFANVAKDPRSTAAAWVSASGPVWEHLIQKQLHVIEGKQWIAVCPDPTIDTIPIEALVPGDAKSDNFRTLPYLVQQYAVGRLPTSSFVPNQRNRRMNPWIGDPFVAVMSADKPASGLAFAQAFDSRVTAESLRTERVGLFKVGEGPKAESAPSADRRPRILVFGHGIADTSVAWEPPTPAVVFLLDPPSAKDGSNYVYRWLLRGVRGVLAPKGPIEKPVEDALVAGTLKSLGLDGGNPIDALSAAKRSLLSGSLKSAVPGLTEAHYHPAHWTQMQAWLINP